MARKGKRKNHLASSKHIDKEVKDLDRFAGSSDEEEEEEELPTNVARDVADDDEQHDTDQGDHTDEDKKEESDKDDSSSSSSIQEEQLDASSKMANAMGKILGGTKQNDSKQKATTLPVVLAKTTTPLQKLQQREKEKLKALKEKRKVHQERNLSALHFPLSIATTNTVQTEGRLSVAKELEQERFHRRVATRGVVALFNAISQHQRTNSEVCICFNCCCGGFCCWWWFKVKVRYFCGRVTQHVSLVSTIFRSKLIPPHYHEKQK